MKKRTLSLFFLAGISALALTSYKSSPGTTTVGNRTGSPGSTATCATSCHAASSSKTLASFMIAEAATPTTPVSKYVPGKLYTITLAGTSTTAKSKFGFQATVTNGTGASLGTLTATAASTAVHTAGGVNLVEHTGVITSATAGVFTVKFNWTAPAKGAGTATIYGILNAVDGNNSDSNDEPSNGFKLIVDEDLSSSISEQSAAVALQIVPNPATDRFSVSNLHNPNATIAIYGMNGAKVMQVANSNSIDISGLSAGAYIVQINDNGSLSATMLMKQ